MGKSFSILSVLLCKYNMLKKKIGGLEEKHKKEGIKTSK
jgi:hypothetical protein